MKVIRKNKSPRRRLSYRTIRMYAVVALLGMSAVAAASGRTVLVLDASGSMWGQIDGKPKISIAREVIGDLLDNFPGGQELGLHAYGHRRKGDCSDIEELVPAATGNREAIREAVAALNPKGMTPLSDAVRLAAESLRYVEAKATVILVSDGIENCDRDPCAMGASLESAGVDFTAHVVGFDVAEPEAQAQLRCLAENTGGSFYPASDASALQAALGEVAAAVAAAPEYPDIVLGAPETATVGDLFEVSRSATVSERDFIAVVPADARDNDLGNHRRAVDGNPLALRAQAEPGLYEIRYIVDATRDVIARRPIELVDAQVVLEAPEAVTVGSEFEVVRDRTVSERDLITIVAVDARDRDLGNLKRAGKESVVTLRAPGEPGLFELRYVLDEGRRVIGRRAIEVTPAQVRIEAPASVTAGSAFEVTRSATVDHRDLITIVPPDAKDSELGNLQRARNELTTTLTAPAEPGLYEVRYVLDEGRTVVARQAVEVTGAELSLEAPASVIAGSSFEVTRTGTVNARDFVTIVPVDAKDSELGNNHRARSDLTVELTAPAEPGLYEVRYVLDEGRTVVARQAVEVTGAELSLEAPASVMAGDDFEVKRSATVNARDFLAIAPVGAPDNELANYKRARDDNPLTMKAPDEPGLYEVRYVLDQGRSVLARAVVEVTPVAAEIADPGQVVAGADFAVSWQGPNRRGDVIELAAAGADTPMASADVRRGGELRFTAPGQAGLYTLRYRLKATGEVIAQTDFEVATLDAAITAPASAAPGETVTVSWTGPGGDQDRIALARPEQSAFQWVIARKTSEGAELVFEMPAEAGLLEFRYVDVVNRVVLATVPIEVKP